MNAVVFLFYLFIFSMPFEARLSFLPGFWGRTMTFANIIFVFLFLAWSFHHLKKGRLPECPPFFWQAFFFLFAAILSYLFHPSAEGLTYLVGYCYLTALFLLSLNILEEFKIPFEKILRFGVAFYTFITVVTLAAIFLYFFGIDSPFAAYYSQFSSLIPFARAEGLSIGSNSFALQLHVMILFAFYFWIQNRGREKSSSRSHVFSFVLLSSVDFLTCSRLIVGTFFSFWILLGRLTQDKWLSFTRKALGAFLLILLPITFFFSIYVVMPVRFSIHPSPQLEWNSWKNHYYLLAVRSYKIFWDHPSFGIGIGNFRTVMRDHYLKPEEVDAGGVYTSPKNYEKDPLLSHHLYGGWISQTGGLGFVAFILFFGGIFYEAWKRYREKADLKIATIWACLAGFALDGIFNDFVTLPFFWLCLAILTYGYKCKGQEP